MTIWGFQRKTQNLKSSELKAAVAQHKSQSDDSSSVEDIDENNVSDDEANQGPKLPADVISKRINPNNFVLPVEREGASKSDDSDSDENEQNTFDADMATFASGIE